MSGSGRKSSYRKSVSDSFLNDVLTSIGEDEEVAKVCENRGANTFEVVLNDGSKHLSKLPKKFHKLIWIKKNDFVLIDKRDVSFGDNVDSAGLAQDEEQTSSIDANASSATRLDDTPAAVPTDSVYITTVPKSAISHELRYIRQKLNKDSIKALRKGNLWPSAFDLDGGCGNRATRSVMPGNTCRSNSLHPHERKFDVNGSLSPGQQTVFQCQNDLMPDYVEQGEELEQEEEQGERHVGAESGLEDLTNTVEGELKSSPTV